MALTLSHLSALDVMRKLRSQQEESLEEYATTEFEAPELWEGKKWGKGVFKSESWKWGIPTPKQPLHVLVPVRGRRIRSSLVVTHEASKELSAESILWLDEHSSMVCPELLFLQMATVFTLPKLVLLGYELCGNFTRMAEDPREGPVVDNVPAATNVENISRYLEEFPHTHGVARAKQALSYVSDDALSATEAVLATIYSLPSNESGYGMGPITLNTCVRIARRDNESTKASGAKKRYPDLMFPFAPVGINYDGGGHLDLDGLVKVVLDAFNSNDKSQENSGKTIQQKLEEVRAKAVDDNVRDRQLISKGKVVLRATKEDVNESGALDALTQQVLDTARTLFGTDVAPYQSLLDDTTLAKEREELLFSLLPTGKMDGSSRGSM